MKTYPQNYIAIRGDEKIDHLIYKTMIAFAIFKKNKPRMQWPGQQVMLVEGEQDNGVPDVLDLRTKIAWEIETNPSRKRVDSKQRYTQNSDIERVIVIDTRKMDKQFNRKLKEVFEMLKELVEVSTP
jgi:hypothetical protein